MLTVVQVSKHEHDLTLQSTCINRVMPNVLVTMFQVLEFCITKHQRDDKDTEHQRDGKDVEIGHGGLKFESRYLAPMYKKVLGCMYWNSVGNFHLRSIACSK